MQPHTYLFSIRLWREEIEDGRYQWRGHVRSRVDGPAHYFVGLHSANDLSAEIAEPASTALTDTHEQEKHMKPDSSSLGAIIEQMIKELEGDSKLV